MGLAFQEWALAATARSPGWIAIERFLGSAIGKGQILSILVFDSQPRKRSYLLTHELTGDELRASGEDCVRRALRRAAFVMLLLQDALDMKEAFGEYELSAEGPLGLDADEQLFGAPLAGFREALDEGRHALVISHDGDPLYFIHQGSPAL